MTAPNHRAQKQRELTPAPKSLLVAGRTWLAVRSHNSILATKKKNASLIALTIAFPPAVIAPRQ